MPQKYDETCAAQLSAAFKTVPHHAHHVESAVEHIHCAMGRLLWDTISQGGDLREHFAVSLIILGGSSALCANRAMQNIREFFLLRDGDFFTTLAHGAIGLRRRTGKLLRDGGIFRVHCCCTYTLP